MPAPVGLPELVEEDPGTNVADGFEMHDSAAAAASADAALVFSLAFPPKSHAAELRFWVS